MTEPDLKEPKAPKHPMGVNRFERLFRAAAGLDIDKQDIKRYREFIARKIHDLLIRGEAIAKANGRDVIAAFDLPITKGLQECVERFASIDRDIDVQPIIDEMTPVPWLDLAISDETRGKLPEIAGGLSVALARSFKIIEPDLKNPQTKHWERSIELFDLVV
jgi:hypothetical protein